MKRVLTLLAFATALACNPNLTAPAGKRYPSSCREPGHFLDAMTWNVGLAPGVVPYATPRTKAVAEELANFKSMGLICLQEVWTQEAKDAVVASLGLPADQVYYVDTRGMGEEPPGSNACSPRQIGPLAECVRENCADIDAAEETTVCANEMCHQELVSLYMDGGRDCLDCLVASVGKSLPAIEAQCTKPAPGITRAFGGQNGVMLISRWPLVHREWELLPASYSNRVALFATIELEGREPIEVACTHASTYAEMPPGYKEDGKTVFGDWDDEMIKQISIISGKLAKRAGTRPQLFLGDMNAGPEIPPYVHAAMPKVWRKIVSLGFSSPAAQALTPFCSTCSGNSLRDADAQSYLIDHVLVRDPPGGSRLEPRCVRPVIDEGHMRYLKGYKDGLIEEHLSDHYGVNVTFSYE